MAKTSTKPADVKLPPKESPQSNWLLLIGIAMVVVGFVLVQFPLKSTSGPDPSTFVPTSIGDHFRNDGDFKRLYTDIKQIPKEEWSPDKPVAPHLLHSPIPRVVRNSFISKWDALGNDPQKKWDVYSQIWRNRISPQISGVYVGKSPYFGPLFRTNRPLHRAFNMTWDNPFHREVKSPEELFAKITASKDRQSSLESEEFFYYTGGLNTPNLAKDVEPWKELIPREEEPLVNVWAGEKGCVTHLHIDSYENFFVQIQGRKRFLLIPPEQSDMCYLYPFQHPSHGQSQVYLVNPPANETAHYQPGGLFPHAKDVTVYEVEVEAGDLLYLPPNWFHQVHTLEPSISVNFWSVSDAQVHYNAAIDVVSKNLIHHWAIPQKRTAALLLIRSILANSQVRRGMKVWGDDRDQDPYDIVSSLQDRYGSRLLDEKGNINYELVELVELNHTPFKDEGETLISGEAFKDGYTNKYFERYLLPRYESGFVDGTYPRFPSSFNRDQVDADQFQKDLMEYCEFNDSLVMEGFTVDEYIEQYQGAGMLFSNPYVQTHQPGNIPDEVYQKSLIVLALDTATHLAKIAPSNRPIYMSNLFESIALWASSPKGNDIPRNIYCFGTIQA